MIISPTKDFHRYENDPELVSIFTEKGSGIPDQ